MVEFVYNNKVQTSTRVSLYKANNGWDQYMGFKMRKNEKFKRAEEFAKRMKEVHKEAEATLRKSQKEIRKYTDRKRNKPEKYRVDDWVLLSIKDLKFQMKERCSEKLTEQFCHDLAKQLSYYLYFFYFILFYFLSWTYYTRKECGKVSYDNVVYHSHISGCHSVTSHEWSHMISVGE